MPQGASNLRLGALLARLATPVQFGVPLTSNTVFLGYLLAWLLLFVSLISALALWLVGNRMQAIQRAVTRWVPAG